MNLFAKIQLQYQLASKTRFYKAVVGAAAGGAATAWATHASPKGIVTAAATAAGFAALNFIRDPQFSTQEKLDAVSAPPVATPTDPAV